MKVDYVLVATGNFLMQPIHHGIVTVNDKIAIEKCLERVKTLSKAGYFSFTLFDVKDESDHKQICIFRVEQPEPIVSVKN